MAPVVLVAPVMGLVAVAVQVLLVLRVLELKAVMAALDKHLISLVLLQFMQGVVVAVLSTVNHWVLVARAAVRTQ